MAQAVSSAVPPGPTANRGVRFASRAAACSSPSTAAAIADRIASASANSGTSSAPRSASVTGYQVIPSP